MKPVFYGEEVQAIKDKEFKKVELNHMLADNCAMQLLRHRNNSMYVDNLFEDMLSDEAAMLTGSLGLLPSASLGIKDKNGRVDVMSRFMVQHLILRVKI